MLQLLAACSLAAVQAHARYAQMFSKEDVAIIQQALAARLDAGAVELVIEELIARHKAEGRFPFVVCGIASYRTPEKMASVLFQGLSTAPSEFRLTHVEDRSTGDGATRASCEAAGIYVNQ